jgi:large subunit ribosomal protein L22
MAVTIEAPHARAIARYVHVSAPKVRQVLDLVRGLPVDDAERVLLLCQKDAAADVLKVLGSAIANAEHNHALPPDELFVAVAYADEGPTRKWGQARARGRYFRVRKRTAHITVYVARLERDELERRQRRDEATGRGAATAQRRRAERVRRSRRAPETTAPEHDHDHEHESVEDARAKDDTLAQEAAEATEGGYVDVDEALAEAEDETEADEVDSAVSDVSDVSDDDTEEQK